MAAPEDTGSKQAATQFKPGQSGNPAGRPLGARSKLSEAFLDAMQQDFAAHGVSAIVKVRTDKPDQYLKVIASILPKDLNINVNQFDGLPDADIIERIRALDDIIRPFLAAAGEGEAGVGTGETTKH